MNNLNINIYVNNIMSAELEKKLRTMKVSDLKKEISKTNVKGYSKLKKEEVIQFMLKNKKRFMYLINNSERINKQFIKKGDKTIVVKKKEKEKPKKFTLEDFIKIVNEFIKSPTQKLLDEIDNKFEFTDDLDEDLLEELEKAINEFEKSKKPKKKDEDNLNFYKEKFKNLNNKKEIIKLWKSIKNENLKNELLLLPNVDFLISDDKYGEIYDYYKEKLQNFNVDNSIKLWESIKNKNLKIQLLQALATKYISNCKKNINEYKVALDLLKKKYTWDDLQERGYGSTLHFIYKTKTNFFKRLDNLKNDCLTNNDLDKLGKLKAGGKDIFLNNLNEKRDLEKNIDNENKLKNEYLKLRKKKPEKIKKEEPVKKEEPEKKKFKL